MKTTFKKFFATLLTVLFLFSLSSPVVASAEQGTLGTETPYLSCTFEDENEAFVDGNALEAGTYIARFVLSGMQSVSIFELTAQYDDSVVAISDITTIAEDETQNMELAAVKNEDGDLVVILVTENEEDNCTPLGAPTTMITMSVTITGETPVDFADVFVVNIDPHLTYVEADYRDGTDAGYVSEDVDVESYDDESFVIYPSMKIDVSPSLVTGADISGQIVVANDATGTTYPSTGNNGGGVGGITVSVDVDEETTISAVTAADGTYTLEAVPAGEYTMTISGPTTVDRNVTLIVADADKTVAAVPVITCDFEKDGGIGGGDTGYYTSVLFGQVSDANSIYCDLDCDGGIGGSDTGIYTTILFGTIDYADVTL